MNRILNCMQRAFVLALSVVFVACTQNVEEVDTTFGYTKLTVGMSSSRTEMGDKVDGVYQIFWSEGDQIVVNGGVSSKSEISEDRKSATFHFENSVLEPPYHLTYPHTDGSLCADGRPTVTFPANQEYVAKSFGVGYAPMYGYCEQGEASMSHLAGVLRFAVTGKETLSTIEIIADEGVALSGEFDVNCKSGALSAIDGKVSNKITYTANKELTENVTFFHITVPHGNLGKCQVVLTDKTGFKMNLKWTATNVTAGIVREFTPFAFKGGAEFELQEMSSVTDDLEIVENPQEYHDGVWGYVKYSDGSPAVGVSVSDGFSVIKTNEEGFYQFESGVNAKTKYIYLSLPAEAKVTTNSKNQVNFFRHYIKTYRRYNFTLEKITKESDFSLFVMADTHGYTANTIARLERELIPGIRAEKALRSSKPCYSIICGDIVCSGSTDKDEVAEAQPGFMTTMCEKFAASNTDGVPTLFVMGNHDHYKKYFDAPQYSDIKEFNYHIQDCYEQRFGPANYSLNRGDVHIVCMRDILWPETCITNSTSAGCYGGFSDEQVEWLRQDLADVPKDKMIILCVHIPLATRYNNEAEYPNITAVVDLIKPYAKKQVFSGHEHHNYNIPSSDSSSKSKVNEMSFVGNWGHLNTRCMGDGSPFGFGVYEISGAAIVDNYFRPCTSRTYDKNYQMRIYLSDMVCGADITGTNKYGQLGWYGSFIYTPKLGSVKEYVYVTIFNGGSDWSVKLKLGSSEKSFNYLTPDGSNDWSSTYSSTDKDSKYVWKGKGTGTQSDPFRVQDSGWLESFVNTNDWWLIGGLANNGISNAQTLNGLNCHMFRCQVSATELSNIKSGATTFEVVATDPYGNVYRSSKLFDVNDVREYLLYD